MEFNLEDIIGVVAVFQSALLVIFFLTNKRGDSTGNKIFAALLFTFMLSIGNSLTTTDALYKHFHGSRKIIVLIGQTAFLIAPLLYFYFKSINIPILTERQNGDFKFVFKKFLGYTYSIII